MTETEQWQSALFALLLVSCDRSPMAGFCYESNIHTRTLKQLSVKLKHFHIHFLSHDSCSLLIITFQSSANVLYFWIQSQCRIEMLNDLSMKKFFSVFFSFFFLPLWHTTWSLIWSEIPCFFNLEAELQEKQVTAGRRLETDYRWIWLFSVAPIIHVARGQGGLREPRHATQKDMQFTASTSQ